jgi:zinc protease
MTSLSISNGLRVLVVPDAKASDVSVTVRYPVGFVDDPAGQEGMAHLAEHVLFQQVLANESLFAKLERLTTDFNGFTLQDTTTFVERAPPSHLTDLLAIEGDRIRLRCETVTEDAFRRERQVVIEEHRDKGDVFAIFDAVFAALYPDDHPYHRKSGDASTLVSITRAQTCAFIDHHYTVSNAIIVVSGKVTVDDVTRALEASAFTHLPKHDVDPRPDVPLPAGAGRRVTQRAPIDERVVLFAWPIPKGPRDRALMLAMRTVLRDAVDRRVSGHAAVGEFGGERAPMLVLAVTVPSTENVDHTIDAIRRAIAAVPDQLRSFHLEHARQTAAEALLSIFEDGSRRDLELAREMITTGTIGDAYTRALDAVMSLEPDEARDASYRLFTIARAHVIVLEPSDAIRRERTVSFDSPTIHETGQLRLSIAPSEAAEPSHSVDDTTALAAIETSTLANGLRVVLMPASSVPTIDMRLVFDVGTADEEKPGTATVAAYGLEPSIESIQQANAAIAQYAAGADITVDVGVDRVVFGVRGIAMYADFLLAGLGHVVDGKYTDVAMVLFDVRRVLAKHPVHRERGRAWRDATFGADHPYALIQHTLDNRVKPDDVSQFRDRNFTPANATLVVAGGFDPSIVMPWIEYTFGRWRGAAPTRADRPARVTAASLGRIAEGERLALSIVLPASRASADRARQLVAAEMLAQLVADVRHQLAASYSLGASLAEARLAVQYEIAGTVEPARAAEAMTLIRERAAQLRGDPAALASAFVTARERVLARLRSVQTGSRALADRAEAAIALGRDLRSDFVTARAVRALTLNDMAATLRSIDLSRAAMLLRGPREAIERAFAAVDRKPTFVTD